MCTRSSEKFKQKTNHRYQQTTGIPVTYLPVASTILTDSYCIICNTGTGTYIILNIHNTASQSRHCKLNSDIKSCRNYMHCAPVLVIG